MYYFNVVDSSIKYLLCTKTYTKYYVYINLFKILQVVYSTAAEDLDADLLCSLSRLHFY